MKLFQIEEPDGAPEGADGPGAAVGIDLAAAGGCAVAVAVGGNAEILPDEAGAHLAAPASADGAALAAALRALRRRAERQLARPVTHAVIAARPADAAARRAIEAAAGEAGLVLLRLVLPEDAARGAAGADAAVLGAALAAEELAPPAVPAP